LKIQFFCGAISGMNKLLFFALPSFVHELIWITTGWAMKADVVRSDKLVNFRWERMR
jgi:hypothetical protein